jgi:hypothetical protein
MVLSRADAGIFLRGSSGVDGALPLYEYEYTKLANGRPPELPPVFAPDKPLWKPFMIYIDLIYTGSYGTKNGKSSDYHDGSSHGHIVMDSKNTTGNSGEELRGF